MAQVGELLIALQGDSKSWSSALKTAGQDLRKLASQAKETGQDLNKFNAQTINLLKGWKNEVGNAYRSVEQSLAPVRQGLVDQGKALDVNQKGINTLAIQTVTASEKMRVFSDSLKSTSSALWLMTMGLQQFGRAMSISFTAPIVAAAGLSVKTFMDWEKGTLAIQRAAEITGEEAEKITDSFIEISSQVPITVEELQKAGYAAAQAGVTGERAITNFAEAAVKLSKVGGDAFRDLPIEKLANDLAKLTIAFGETGENMEEVNNTASMLLSVAKAVPGGLAEIVEGLRRVAGPAATLNVSLADTTALIGALIAAGVPAARAGTELGRVFLDMTKNIDKVSEALGYTTENFGEFKERMETDVMGVLVELLGRYKQIESGVDRATHLQEIFGTTSLRALMPLIENYDMILDLQARANQELESGALLAAEFDIQANSLSGTMQVFGNNLKILAGVIGKDLAPYVSYFLKTFTLGLRNLVEGWRNLNPHIKFAIFLVGGLLAVVGPLALLLNTLFLNPISGLITFLAFLTKATGQLALQTGIAASAGAATNFFAFSLTNAATAAGLLVKGLAILSLKFAAILIVVGLVAAALYALGRALGISLKLPKMPKIALPKYKGVTAPKYAPGEAPEEIAKADEKAAKKKAKDLARELRDKKKARKKELRALREGIKDYEKVRKAEIKERQKLVDEQKDALDQRREQWEDERRIEDEKIRIQQETLESIKKTLKESKKALSELKKVYGRELDTAEGRVDYAEMNLDAAQDALKREKILGRDEFDASFRAAEARVKAWEDATQLARESVIKVKREYQKQIDAQEDLVDINKEQVDIQADALDDLKDALAERRAIVDKEIDVLQDELKVRQDALADTREATQEKLDLLREERDTRQEAWDDEIAVIQDRLDAARDYAAAIADRPVPELPDIAGTMGELDEELKRQLEDMQTGIGEALSLGVRVEPGGLLARLKEAWEILKDEAKRQGKSVTRVFFEATWAGLPEFGTNWMAGVFDAIFGVGAWDEIHRMAEEEGKTIPQLLWEGFLLGIKGIPEKIKASIERDFIQPFRNAFPEFFKTGEEGGRKTKEGLAKGGEGTEYEGSLIIQNFIKGLRFWGGIYSVLGNIRTSIWQHLGTMGGNAWEWGKNLVDNFKRGMEWAGRWIKSTAEWIGNLIKNVWESLSPPKEGPLKDIDKWGANLVKTYADSITKGLPYLERTMEDVSGSLGASFAGGAAAAIPAGRPAMAEQPVERPAVYKTYEIKPGVMIASRGEVRNFMRLLKEYDQFEEDR